MPLRLMLLFVVLTPLIGIMQVEAGAFAGNVNVWGHRNGATLAFVVYGLCVFAAAWLATRGSLFAAPRPVTVAASRATARASCRLNYAALLFNGLMCLATLFLFGGLDVLAGDVGKGEFRSSLGGLGALAYLTLKWFAPSAFALSCASYALAGRPAGARGSLVALGLVTFVIGLSWGFKTSGLLILLPGFIALLWNAPMRKFAVFAILGFGAILLAFALFDTVEGSSSFDVLEFLLARLTVYQGDVAWYIWDLWTSGIALPDYAVTLLVAGGDQLFSLISGITRDQSERWVLTHFGSLLTYTVGYPIEGIEAGHNVTGTPFAEGVIAAGAFGILIFGLLAGAATGFVYIRIAAALRRHRPVSVALWCNYSVWCLFAWLNGGDIVQLFHVSVFVGAAMSWGLLRVLHGLANIRLSPPRPRLVPASA